MWNSEEPSIADFLMDAKILLADNCVGKKQPMRLFVGRQCGHEFQCCAVGRQMQKYVPFFKDYNRIVDDR